MPDDPKPRFKPEDLFPRDFEEQLTNAFEESLRRKEHAEIIRSVIEVIMPTSHALAYHAAGFALESYADSLETATITTDSEAARDAANIAIKTAVDGARSLAKHFHAQGKETDPTCFPQ